MGWKRTTALIGLGTSAVVVPSAVMVERYINSRLPAETPAYETATDQSLVCLSGTVEVDAEGTVISDTCDAGNALAIWKGEGNQIPIESLDQVSPLFINALVATENDEYYTDSNGIDELSILPALVERRGFSTIEMQLARNLYRDDVPKGDSKWAKARRKDFELRMARKLNEAYSKEEILLKYINTVYFGRGAYGAMTGSMALFDKTPDTLDLLESATAAGIVRKPSLLDGNEDPAKDALERDAMKIQRNHVLVRMREEGYLDDYTAEQFQALLDTGLDYVKPYDVYSSAGFFPQPLADTLNARHYLDLFVQDFRAKSGYTDEQLSHNLKIVTSLRYDAQAYLNDAINNADYPRDGREMAGVMIGPEGDVIAMVGGQDYPNHQVNLTIESQPVGSNFKKFGWTVSFMNDVVTLEDTFPEPSSFVWEGANADGTNWEPTGGDHCSDHSSCSVAEAIAVSSNPILLGVMHHQGMAAVEQAYNLAEAFGAHSDTLVLPAGLLGAREVSLLDNLAATHGLIARQGHVTPYHLLRGVYEYVNGRAQERYAYKYVEGELLVEAEPVRMITEGMRGVARRANGTAHNKLGDFPSDLAVKTGSDDDNVSLIDGSFCSSVLGGNVSLAVSERFRDNLTQDLGPTRTGGNGPAAVFNQAALPLTANGPCSLN